MTAEPWALKEENRIEGGKKKYGKGSNKMKLKKMRWMTDVKKYFSIDVPSN